MKISVSLAYNIPEPLTYQAAAGARGIRPGARVLVPLGKRLALGWVLDLDSPYTGRVKNIIGVVDDPFCPDESLLEFARRAAAAYFASAGGLLDHCLPPSQKNPKNLRLEHEGRERRMAEVAAEELVRLAASGPLRFFYKTPSPTGVGDEIPAGAPAGSGTEDGTKTVAATAAYAAPEPRGRGSQTPALLLGPQREREYREACAQALAGGSSVMLVVPDNATADYWQTVIAGVDPYHSGLKPAAREKTWRHYRLGKDGIVCGGVSALMLPLVRPGLLIVDRAASSLYRRGLGSPFRVDHLAEIRAATAGIPLIRGADSHSCATYAMREGARIDDRRQQQELSCQVHMLKARERGIPPEIVELVRQNYLAGKKTLVLVNRIQPAVHLYCDACRRLAACPRCGGVLQADEGGPVSCRRCSYHKENLAGCPRCGKPLEPLHDVSIDSLRRAMARVSGEEAVLALTASELREPRPAVAAAAERPIVIATLAALNPFFAGLFASAVWVKPESFFGMEEYDAAEMIHAGGAEIMATLAKGGEMHVFSVFHFHYALQYLTDEAAFFARELKYRRWFMLPPYASVYELELREAGLRRLAAAMRGIYGTHKEALQIKRIYLVSRLPQRGTYRGILELHAAAEKVAASGLQRIKKSVLRRTAG